MTTAASTPSWSPTANDHLIFKWIKLEGKSQSSVASAFGISQPTVSRIIQRYERWQAHAAEREDGRLDHTERLRAQRWLTYVRNELLLNNCLRIAKEMEGFAEVSKETVSRSTFRPDNPEKFRTETAHVDRSGIAARFIRLAFRINMEQLKLTSLDPAPPAIPLSANELAALQNDALATQQEFSDARNRSDQQAQTFASAGFAKPAPYPTPETADTYKPDPFAWPIPQLTTPDATDSLQESNSLPGSPLVTPSPEPPVSSATAQSEAPEPETCNSEPETLPPPSTSPPSTCNLEPETCNSLPIHSVNNLNNDSTPEIAATSTAQSAYENPPLTENFSAVNNNYHAFALTTAQVPVET